MTVINARPRDESPANILLVEDEINDQALFRVAARRTQLSLQIHSVGHGQQAIDYLQGTPPFDDRDRYPLPDVLVLDLRMPVLDGFEFLVWRQTSPLLEALPVVVLSGSPNEGWQDKARALGASGFFEKPFCMEDWIAMVREIWAFARMPASPFATGMAQLRLARPAQVK